MIVIIIIIITAQIDRFLKNCRNLELECKNAGKTKIRTPSI